MTTDRRVSTPAASPWSAHVELHSLASATPSWLAALAFAALMLGWAWLDSTWAIAVYVLSFWHYYLYWLAYYFGAIAPGEFKRDAVMWKAVALVALACVYFAAPLNLLSLCVVATGFLLNCLAAKALGPERTYYGYELMDLPLVKITAFPYSWIAHPMLVGNMTAFAGTLLNEDFRRLWWPLAVAHVLTNLGLLVMELAVTPQRRRVCQRGSVKANSNERHLQPADFVIAVGAALIAGIVAWNLASPHSLLAAAAAALISIYALALFRRYTATPVAAGPGPPSHRETLPETLK